MQDDLEDFEQLVQAFPSFTDNDHAFFRKQIMNDLYNFLFRIVVDKALSTDKVV
jgi:hypothetical protein